MADLKYVLSSGVKKKKTQITGFWEDDHDFESAVLTTTSSMHTYSIDSYYPAAEDWEAKLHCAAQLFFASFKIFLADMRPWKLWKLQRLLQYNLFACSDHL